jgi:hypothetical protein
LYFPLGLSDSSVYLGPMADVKPDIHLNEKNIHGTKEKIGVCYQKRSLR